MKQYLPAIGFISSWGGLGFYRGVNEYKYIREKYIEKDPYLYTSSILTGFIGTCIYINPIFLPILLYKELYRLEVNIRKLENEKTSSYYNKILF